MLANLELTEDFSILSRQKKRLVEALLNIINIPPIHMNIQVTQEGDFRGFDAAKLYVVEQGSVAVRYQQRTVYVLDEGDMLLPDITGTSVDIARVYYGSDTGARVASYPALEFMRRVFDSSDAVKLWTRLLVTYSGLVMRVAAARTEQDCGSSPGFEKFEPDEVIIREGERADYVYNLSDGVAEATVDGVLVGRINAGEIFGAMAALTQADRSATIKAKTRCSVVKVPKEQFTDLIRTNPATIHSLLIDMANSIVNLNERLVSLRQSEDD